jgi:histidyl-tRNA synthetase
MKNIPKENKDIHLAILDSNLKMHAIKLYDYLIKNNYSVYWNYKYNLKKSLSSANEMKANFIIIVGENEKINNNYTIKNLSNGKQTIVDINNIFDHLK